MSKETKEYVYQLASLNKGKEFFTIEELEATNLIDDLLFTARKEELIGQPILKGYLGPMYNGMKDGKTVIRYETQEVYNLLSGD